ncbi:hypothetical protein [Variovorax sp. OV700]|uniref:hypothetical protein n=1 Tax=Variovorax sp. OV700 TaxID=1882826 RepID=UPI000886C784|nr:hypothetical protein [Variovorax sp. OV700]SDI59408.1 hypothetical protein SAMN05444748_10619 [Variovorax sp. OV700]
MLTLSERDEVILELTKTIIQGTDIRGMVRAALVDEDESNRLLTLLPIGVANAGDLASILVAVSIRDQWRAQPTCWLASIITRLNLSAQLPAFRDVVNRLNAKINPNPDPFDKTWLRKERLPFFDRVKFRAMAKALIESGDQPILKVNGPPGSGRSFSLDALGAIASIEPKPPIVFAVARINAEFQALYKVWQLASDLASQMKLTQPNQPANTDASSDDLPPEAGSSYPATLARWILFNARQQTDLHVFVIEGAFAQDVDPDIPLFVNALAQQICLPTQRQQMRLILIDAIGELVGVQDADWVEETLTDAADLIPDDLVPCIERLNQIRAEKGLAQMPELPLVMAKAILREAPAAGKARLAHLHKRLRGLLPPAG